GAWPRDARPARARARAVQEGGDGVASAWNVRRFTTRVRLAGMGGALCAAVSVLAFGTTTMPRLVSSAVGFLIGATMGFAVGGCLGADRVVRRDDGTLNADIVARLVIAWGLVALGAAALVVRGWDLRIVLVTMAFLVVAAVCTFCRSARGG